MATDLFLLKRLLTAPILTKLDEQDSVAPESFKTLSSRQPAQKA